MKKRKIAPDLAVMLIGTGVCCLAAALSGMGILDGIFLEPDGETVFSLLVLGLLGAVNMLGLLLPLWALYGYIRVAVGLHRQKDRTGLIVWLITVPAGAAVLTAAGVILYWMTHQVCY